MVNENVEMVEKEKLTGRTFKLSDDVNSDFDTIVQEFKSINPETTKNEVLRRLIEIKKAFEFKNENSDRKKDIEQFEYLLSKLLEVYNHSIELNADSENRAKEEFKEQLSKMAEKIEKLTAQNEDKNEQILSLKANKKELEKEIEGILHIKKTNALLEEQIKDKVQHIGALENENKQIEPLKKQIDLLVKEKAEQTMQLSSATNSVNALKSEKKVLESQINSNEKLLLEKEKELENRKEQIEKLEHKNEKLNAMIIESNNAKAEAKSDKKVLEERVRNYEKTLNNYSQKLKKMNERLNAKTEKEGE